MGFQIAATCGIILISIIFILWLNKEWFMTSGSWWADTFFPLTSKPLLAIIIISLIYGIWNI